MKLFTRGSLARWIVLGAAASFPAAAWAGVGGIAVNVLPLPSPIGGGHNSVEHGRIEYRVQIKNTAKEDRIVHLRIPAPNAYRPDAGTIVSRTLPIAAGQDATVSLLQFTDLNEGSMEVRVEGFSEKETMTVGIITGAYYPRPSYGSWGTLSGSAPLPAVLLSRSISLDFYRSPVAEAIKPRGATGPTAMPAAPDFAFFHSELPMTQWSANWLGYSCFDAVLLTAKDVEQLPPEAQLALRRYLECGGCLVVHGQKVPAVFSQSAREDGGGGYFVGRGHAVASGARSESNWAMAARSLRSLSLRPYHTEGKPADPHNLLVAESRVPVRGMFALVLVFAVGIGPVNLWLLARYKRRIWLWWDVPAISLVTCLAVFGYSVLSEGWRGHGKTASMTLLDQRTRRATTFGYASYYCPLTPSSGPRFGVDTDVTMTDDQSSSYDRDPYGRRRANLDARYVDTSGEQQFGGGWVRARVPAYFPFCKNEDRRERLSFSMKGNTPAVVNALGADIERLYWADASGKVFEGRGIAAGAEKALAAAAVSPVLPAQGRGIYQELLGVNAAGDMLGFLDRSQPDNVRARWLVPGSYIAYLKKSPFAEASLVGTPSEDTVAMVYGICESHENGR